ncbi:branched-chain amino acid ABC transporter permease [Ideonella sp. DXS22W]|uniref:Branched-chain amino acid ABC transporter permease n=1 Tax=Pseudaquabacterium inlustre TaxID=2984192 RepID=A0ABU9CR90_9BURK
MNAALFSQAVASGITNGSVYALIGLGLAVVFKGARIINVTQGEFAVVGALMAVLCLQRLGWPYPAAMAAGVASGALTGLFIDWAFVRPMLRRGANEESFLLLTIGLAFTLSAAALYFGGRSAHLLPALGGEGIVELGAATVRTHALWLVAIAAVVVLALRWFYRHTLLGLSITAASSDAPGAATVGVDVAACRRLTFLLGGGLGAIAGILVTPLTAMNYHMGIALTLKGFAAAILGGLVNPFGAIVGGLVLGLVESLALVVFPSGYKEVVAMALLILIMLLMPYGILGRAGRVGG